jgi:N-acetylglucosaminyldiphosphoundecaprenol N-acetyl-beta-D-mannosaminyltransferase
MKKQLLGVNITVDSKDSILQNIEGYLQGKSKSSPFVVVTPNPEQIVYAQQDEEFLKLLNRADVALPDGIGLVWAMKYVKKLVVRRISGVDFMSDCIRLANKHNYPIGLIGGWNGVAKKTLSELQNSYTNLTGWAMTPEEMSVGKIGQHINDSNTQLVFVGLGAPKQERYIDILKKQCKHVVFMAVGGSFDMIAGVIPRAPIWVQKIGLEWLYRLGKEPWRLKRQMALVRFLFLVFRERFLHT